MINNCVHGVNYAVVGKDGSLVAMEEPCRVTMCS